MIPIRKIGRALYKRLWLASRGYGRPVPAAAWDKSFSAGGWDFLTDMSEGARYAVIHNYAVRSKSPASILDIGCGAGVLRSAFLDGEITNYVGLDISAEAIKICDQAGHNNSRFLVANFDKYAPEKMYDIIIFNESISYALDPRKTLQRYFEYLEADGVCIVSNFDYDGQTRNQWKRLEQGSPPQFSTQLTNEKGKRWDIKVYAKSPAN